MTGNLVNFNDADTSFSNAEDNLQLTEYPVIAIAFDSPDSDKLSDEEIDRKIDESIKYTNKLMEIREQYKPSSHYYRRISDELGGKKITVNGLKYPYEITEKDLLFPTSEEQSDLQPSGLATNATTD